MTKLIPPCLSLGGMGHVSKPKQMPFVSKFRKLCRTIRVLTGLSN